MVPPKNPALRRKHFEKKLARLTEQMIASCDVRNEGVAAVLIESDRAMEINNSAVTRLYNRYHVTRCMYVHFLQNI